MKYVFDIDGTLCTTNKDCDYEKVEPIADRIKIVNRLYDEGHKIILDVKFSKLFFFSSSIKLTDS